MGRISTTSSIVHYYTSDYEKKKGRNIGLGTVTIL